MTPEQPPSSSRRPRPGADARRRALGLEETDGDAATTEAEAPSDAPAPVTEPARRESLRDSLARIPDLAPDDPLPPVPVGESAGPSPAPVAPAPATEAAPPAPASTLPAASLGAGASVGLLSTDEEFDQQLRVGFTAPTAPPSPKAERPAPDRLAATFTVPDHLGGDGGASGPGEPTPPAGRGGRPKPPMWRRITFAVVLLGLVASIPVLGYAGYELISQSKEGTYSDTSLSPSDPGFEAQVDPTPTAVAIQYDDQHNPNGVTFMSLSGGEGGGGSVVFVPLDTEVSEPSYGVNTLRKSYSVVADRPVLARERLASQVGRLVNVGVDEIIDLDNAGWEQLVTPVGPLTINNPDRIDLGFGQVIPTGETTLTAAQTGPYLAATIDGESDLNRMNRHEAVWSAYLEQLEASGKAEAVPGESSAGISKFAQALAKGPVTYDTLPVNVADDNPGAFQIDKAAVNQLVTDTVASPTAAVPGSRFTVRMLNGVSPDAIPSDLVRQIVSRGGAVTILGNGPSFGTDETTVVYANPAKKNLANLVAKSLGATGKVRLDREAPDTVDLTIVLGKDVLGDATGSGSPGATTPETTAAGGD